MHMCLQPIDHTCSRNCEVSIMPLDICMPALHGARFETILLRLMAHNTPKLLVEIRSLELKVRYCAARFGINDNTLLRPRLIALSDDTPICHPARTKLYLQSRRRF
jgi:hypothetical protein